ncbi:MAG TPA: class I SAM-dependent methyltransferase [Thiotrichaceae bacterium]|nr:class I SAM-dependent methyltransferase [Thiotrichaceae bacterium]HIM07362.1 class I SAM-dependent methyltransferase [Gammaproteobacteria bacterium]
MTQQKWDAAEYAKHASFVTALASDVVELLNSQFSERILDVGCGDGELTAVLQAKGCSLVGTDASASMIESTKRRGIEAYVVDGHELDFQNEFDAVFSNAALHWLLQPEKVIQGAYAALKSDGRFVAEFGGAGNIAALLKAMQEVLDDNEEFGEFKSPWFFPTVEEYKSLLETGGFEVNTIKFIPRPTPLTSGISNWLEIFAEGITAHLSDENRKVFISLVEEKLRPVLYSDEEGWVADYVRLRFSASKTK